MSAVHYGCRAMVAGEIQCAIGGGATSFSQEPLIVRGLRWKGFRIGDVKMQDPLFALGYRDFNPVSVDTDNVASEYGVSREEQDEWALMSHQNYSKAWEAGKFKEEMMVLEIPQKKGDPISLNIDEQYRPNTTSVEGQMEGSISMGLGEALFEEVKFDEKGRILNPNLGEYKIPTALDMPNVKSIIVESNEPNGPFGAKEVGEGAILPTIPAILNAVYDATGILIHGLPLTPERVYLAIKAKREKKYTSGI